jgi:hypothetical protein
MARLADLPLRVKRSVAPVINRVRAVDFVMSRMPANVWGHGLRRRMTVHEHRRVIQPSSLRGARTAREPGVHIHSDQLQNRALVVPSLAMRADTTTGDMDSGRDASHRPGMTLPSRPLRADPLAKLLTMAGEFTFIMAERTVRSPRLGREDDGVTNRRRRI